MRIFVVGQEPWAIVSLHGTKSRSQCSRDNWYTRQRVHGETLAAFDHFFTRGPGDAAAIVDAHPHLADRIIPAGNPRLDILQLGGGGVSTPPPPNAPILVTSRFSRSNPFAMSRQDVVEVLKQKFRIDPLDIPFVEKYLAHWHALFDRFLPMVSLLTRHFSDRAIVVRPHPSENFETWRALARTLPNLDVEASGSAVDQAARAALVIHNGCTTGLEAGTYRAGQYWPSRP